MATISHSDLAPAEEVHYSVAGAEFDLTAEGTYETDNAEVIANARAHPWLEVEVAEVASDDTVYAEVRLPATAIDAGLNQKEPEYEGADDEVAETLAAEEEQGDEPIVVDDDPDNDPPVEPVQE